MRKLSYFEEKGGHLIFTFSQILTYKSHGSLRLQTIWIAIYQNLSMANSKMINETCQCLVFLVSNKRKDRFRTFIGTRLYEEVVPGWILDTENNFVINTEKKTGIDFYLTK